nr:hypothetical protein CFP56_58153 [Quercus suber]
MPPRESPTERSYSFISDPSHKETLSGRVTAACLNCRRKKIKCSGEENCQTCRDKGLVCESPPKRKRPAKEAGPSERSGRKGHASTASSSSTQPSLNLNPPERPAASARHSFSYGSSQGSSREGSRASGKNASPIGGMNPSQQEGFHLYGANTWPRTSGQEEVTSAPQVDFSSLLSPIPSFGDIVSFDTSNNPSPAPRVFSNVEEEEWSFLNPGNASPYNPNVETCVSEMSYNPYISSAPMSPVGHERRSPAQHTQWWSADTANAQAATNLISTAELLEEQARSLRQMASSQDRQSVLRHQTTSAPSQTVATMPPQDWDSFDEMALLQTDPQAQPGLTPFSNSEIQTPWWPDEEGMFLAADSGSLSATSVRCDDFSRLLLRRSEHRGPEETETPREGQEPKARDLSCGTAGIATCEPRRPSSSRMLAATDLWGKVIWTPFLPAVPGSDASWFWGVPAKSRGFHDFDGRRALLSRGSGRREKRRNDQELS